MSSSIGVLTRNTARPFYQQIKDTILQKIGDGDWLPGEKVPSENALVEELGVSRMTVNRALRELTQMGHLKRVHGVGTFVAEPTRHASLIELKNIADEIRAQGRTHRAQVKILERLSADRDVAARMQKRPGDIVFHIVVVHYQDDVPIQLEDRLVNPSLAPGFLRADFTNTTPTEYLMSLFRPDEIEHIVQAASPEFEECDVLAIPKAEPCLRLLRRTWKRDAVVTAVSLLYPSSRYDLVARYSADRADTFSKE